MCPLKREQARRETQQWVMRRLPTADSIVEIGRKLRARRDQWPDWVWKTDGGGINRWMLGSWRKAPLTLATCRTRAGPRWGGSLASPKGQCVEHAHSFRLSRKNRPTCRIRHVASTSLLASTAKQRISPQDVPPHSLRRSVSMKMMSSRPLDPVLDAYVVVDAADAHWSSND